MIDKLNFSGAGANMNIESPQSSIGDSFLNLGKYFTQKDSLEQERLRQQEKDAYQKGRDTILDNRYDEQQLKTDAEKNRLISKEINTANAMQAIYNPDEYKSLRMSAEQKAIQDTLANATPEDRLQMQQELKGYDPKASGQQWVGTAIGQSNVDSSKLADLRINMDKQSADEKYRQDSIALQREQNAISAGARADQRKLDERKLTLEENKLNAPKKEDIKAAETRKGLYARYKELEIKPDSTLTNEQLEDVLKEKINESKDIKKEQKKLRESGNFIETPTDTLQSQRNKFLKDSIAGADGTTYKSVDDEIKKDQDKIDRFLLNAKLKLGKENYSDKQVLGMIANERKNQSISAPWDSNMQDALENVAEQLGISEQDY